MQIVNAAGGPIVDRLPLFIWCSWGAHRITLVYDGIDDVEHVFHIETTHPATSQVLRGKPISGPDLKWSALMEGSSGFFETLDECENFGAAQQLMR